MSWRWIFLLGLLLPELPIDPFQGDAAPSWLQPLGTDALGRNALLRLAHAGARSFGFASMTATLALALALLVSLGKPIAAGARSALRAVPPLLFLLPLAALVDGLAWLPLGILLALLLALQLEPPLRARLEPFTQGPAWAMNRIMGATWRHQLRVWAPWAFAQTQALLPSAWLGALWGEVTLRLLGLGPGPQHDSLGLLLNQELPRLSTDGTPLGWASLFLVLALSMVSASNRQTEAP